MGAISRRPDSEALAARARLVMPTGNTRTALFVAPSPPYAALGEGPELIDVDGHRTIDFLANYTALVHGHAHPVVERAARTGLESGPCFGLPTKCEVELAEELSGRVGSLERLRFANSGTEAVMMAIRTARAATGRDGVLRCNGSYHGMYDDVYTDRRGIHTRAVEETVLVDHNDVAGLQSAVDEHAERLACLLIDLMPNRAGLVRATPEFVACARELADSCGAKLIIDEVISLRIEKGGMQALYDVVPDLTVMGKLIGGGMPVGAFGGNARLMELFAPERPDRVAHGGTFTANPTSMLAGLASLKLLTDAAIDRINSTGDSLRAHLIEMGFTATGSGSLLRVDEVGRDAETWWRLYDLGVLMAPNGLACISTVMEPDHIDRALHAFETIAMQLKLEAGMGASTCTQSWNTGR